MSSGMILTLEERFQSNARGESCNEVKGGEVVLPLALHLLFIVRPFEGADRSRSMQARPIRWERRGCEGELRKW
jgi:hypothetical protein